MRMMNAKKNHVQLLVCTAIMFLLSVSEASAYTYSLCLGDVPVGWLNNTTTMNIHTPSFPPDGDNDRAIRNAISHWNAVSGSNLQFSAGYVGGVPTLGNGFNEIYFSGLDEGTLAMTVKLPAYCYFECPEYVCDCNCYICPPRPPDPLLGECTPKGTWMEADIIVNSNYSWTTAPYSFTKPPHNIEVVVLHELGHVLGLDHENRFQATMNSYYPFGGPLGQTLVWEPLADDRAGARYIYGNGGTEYDLAASAMKSIGGGYSDILAAPSPSPNFVRQGSWLNVEYTILNQGTSYQQADTFFFLSPDKIINSSDINIGADLFYVYPGVYTLTSSPLMIPYGIIPGTYYVGFIVNADNISGEPNPSNNAQYITTPIYVPARLTITKKGSNTSTVISSDWGINCGSDCEEQYALTTYVTLTATPAPGYHFSYWATGSCGTNPVCTMQITGNFKLVAVFSPN